MGDEKRKGEGENKAPDEKRSGRASFDERGNSVWEWQLDTGVYSRDVSTQKLKKLEMGDLSIAETAVNRRPASLGGKDRSPLPGGGFNPYDNSPQVGGGFNPYDAADAARRKFQAPEASPQPRTPADMRKLDELIKKQRAQKNKGE